MSTTLNVLPLFFLDYWLNTIYGVWLVANLLEIFFFGYGIFSE